MELLTIVEGSTFVTTLLLVLSVLPLTYSMLTTRRTIGMPFNFFLFAFCNAYVALLYGALINNRIILTLNSIAFVLQGAAVLAYIAVNDEKSRPLFTTFVAVGITAGIHYYTSILPEHDKHGFLGPIGVTTAVVMLSSPLFDVGVFIQQKSCQGMPVLMTVLSFMCTCSWTLYGHLLNDMYLLLPNLPGFIANGVYFALMAYYGFPEVKQKTS